MKKDFPWLVVILVLLFVVFILSGVFYFNFFLGGIQTGHVVFETPDNSDNSSLDEKSYEVIEGEVIFEKIDATG